MGTTIGVFRDYIVRREKKMEPGFFRVEGYHPQLMGNQPEKKTENYMQSEVEGD